MYFELGGFSVKHLIIFFIILCVTLLVSAPVFAASQDKYSLPEPYINWESAYLQKFPELQRIMDAMLEMTAKQLKKPEQDILHNRICSALVYKMALDHNLSSDQQRLAVAGDLLHNISKEDNDAVLTDLIQFKQADLMVTTLKGSGFFKESPAFWRDRTVFANPEIGNNRGLIHHIISAVTTEQILKGIGGFSEKDIQLLQVGILQHSTGYWYFRSSVDEVTGKSGAWASVYPAPDSILAKLIHDADLISQFVPESVAPEGSKWRVLAQKRWGAKTVREEGHIVYYVFKRLYDEAKTEAGKRMVREKWEQIAPALVQLMGLEPDQDPIKVLGVPKVFEKSI